MTFDNEVGYSFPLFAYLLKKEVRKKGERITKIVIKSHAFLLDRIYSIEEGKYCYMNKK